MARSRFAKKTRGIRRSIRRMKRRYDDFRAAAHEALFGKVWVRWVVLAVLTVLTVSSVYGMACVNGAARPTRDMKWFLRQNGVEVAAPPLTPGSFQGTLIAVPEEDEPTEETEASARGAMSVADALAFLGFSARAEEAMETVPPLETLAPDPNQLAGAETTAPAADAFVFEGDGAEDALPEDDLEEEGEETFEAVAPGDDAPTDTAMITISAVGDCTLGGDAPHGGDDDFDAYVRKYGYDYFFSKVRPVFEADDLTIVNLEGPLTKRTKPRVRKMYTFKGKPGYVKILSGSSVEICNVANNHALDYDVEGLKETADVLEKAGIGVSGFGKVYTTTVRGVRISSMGFTRWQYSARQVYDAVRAERENCDLLIVCMHWGDEGVYRATKQQRKLGRAAIEAGADVVLGSHPHVFGGIEKYKGKYIVYSLGNFCFGGNGNPSDKRTLIFRQRFAVSASGVEDMGIDIIPTAVTLKRGGNDFRPALLPLSRARLLLKNIAKYSRLKADEVKWMDGSYLVAKGLVKAQ